MFLLKKKKKARTNSGIWRIFGRPRCDLREGNWGKQCSLKRHYSSHAWMIYEDWLCRSKCGGKIILQLGMEEVQWKALYRKGTTCNRPLCKCVAKMPTMDSDWKWCHPWNKNYPPLYSNDLQTDVHEAPQTDTIVSPKILSILDVKYNLEKKYVAA